MIAVRFASVSRRDPPASSPSQNNKQDNPFPPNVHFNKHAPIYLTRERWQPRCLPPFCSTKINDSQTPGPCNGVLLHGYATIKILFSEKPKPFSPKDKTPKVISIHTPPAIKTPSLMLPTMIFSQQSHARSL